jgi:8-oxo-dGTP pyrophosphatase MutT (NUDIX family)
LIAAAMPRARTPKRATKKVRKASGASLPRHRQYGVIALRVVRGDQIEVLLLTSRGTGRWVIPKGWRMRDRTPAETALREAYEEAGIKGLLWSARPVGSYRYVKNDERFTGEILVRVFVMVVQEQKKNWPEREERRTRWVTLRRAASLVAERDLAKLLRTMPAILSGKKPPR